MAHSAAIFEKVPEGKVLFTYNFGFTYNKLYVVKPSTEYPRSGLIVLLAGCLLPQTKWV